MKKTIILLGLFVVLLVAGTYARRVGQSDVLKAECEKAGGVFDASSTTCTLPDVAVDEPEPVATTTVDVLADMIVVENIVYATSTEDADMSVMTVSGKARGGWYFEASFPAQLRVGTTTIAAAPGEAQDDWMTGEFVPFVVELEYDSVYSGESATLVLKNDNPSGLPENDRQIEEDVVLE